MQDGGGLRDMGRRWFDLCFNRYTIDGVYRDFRIQLWPVYFTGNAVCVYLVVLDMPQISHFKFEGERKIVNGFSSL